MMNVFIMNVSLKAINVKKPEKCLNAPDFIIVPNYVKSVS